MSLIRMHHCRRNKALISELSTPPPGSKDLYFPTQYSQSFLTQCMACLWKQHKSYWRNPSYTATRIFFTTVIALIFGTIFLNLGKKMWVPLLTTPTETWMTWSMLAYYDKETYCTSVLTFQWHEAGPVQFFGIHVCSSSFHWNSEWSNCATDCGCWANSFLPRKGGWHVLCSTLCFCTGNWL